MPPTFFCHHLEPENSSRLDYTRKNHSSRQEVEEEDSEDENGAGDLLDGESDDEEDIQVLLPITDIQSETTGQQGSSTVKQVTVTSISVSAEISTLFVYLSTSTSTTKIPSITPAPNATHTHSRSSKPTTSSDPSVLSNLPPETSNALPGIFIGSVILLLISCITLIKMRHSTVARRKWRDVKYFCCGRRRGKRNGRAARLPRAMPFWDVGGLLNETGEAEKPLPVAAEVPKLRVVEPRKVDEDVDHPVVSEERDNEKLTRAQSGSISTRSLASSLSISIPPPRPSRYLILANPSPDPPRVSVSFPTPSLSVPASPTSKNQTRSAPADKVGTVTSKRFATVISSHIAADSDELSVSAGDFVRVLSSAGSEDKWVLCVGGKARRGFVPRENIAFEKKVVV
ncbi:hypothetical protein BDQ17DRAFT_1419071 [Cyathus striatus]|nr:hypothetical protein BDQ17DRAFT_1419071 [Cyathus striatus]